MYNSDLTSQHYAMLSVEFFSILLSHILYFSVENFSLPIYLKCFCLLYGAYCSSYFKVFVLLISASESSQNASLLISFENHIFLVLLYMEYFWNISQILNIML